MKFKILFIALLCSAFSWGQVSILSAGTAYTQNFNTLATSGTTNVWADNTTIASWYSNRTVYIGDDGTNTTGGIHSYGTTASSERALGTLTSGSVATAYIGGRYINNTGASVASFDISYRGEEWRQNATAQTLVFEYQVGATTLTTGTWTPVTSLNFTGPKIGTAGALDGNVSGNFLTIIGNVTVAVNNGQEIWFRWTKTSSNSSGLAIDDVSVTASLSVGCSTPTNQTATLTTSNSTPTSADFSWSNGGGATGTVITVRPTATAEVAPVNATSYTPNTNYTTAPETAVSSGNKVVYLNTGATTTTTSLTPGTQYTATAYAYNTPNCYFTTLPETVSFYTLANEPTAHAASFSCNTIATSQINLSFSAANTITNASGYIILYGENTIPTGVPTDGAFHAPGTVFGNATVAGYTATAADTTLNVTGLNGGTTYYFMLVPYGITAATSPTFNYRTTATIPITSGCITSLAPEINVKGIIGSNPSIADGDTTPQGTDNTLFTTIVVGNSQAKNFRIQNLGNAPLSITTITKVGGTAPSDFAVSGITLPTSIAVGASLDFTVTFSPSAAGTRNTTLTIANNDANENPYDFVIQGTGTVVASIDMNVKGNAQSIPDNSIYPIGTNFTAFGIATVGVTTVTRTFTIENLGTTDMTLSGTPFVVVTGPHAALFTVTAQPASATVTGGSSVTFDITFNPNTPGAKNATVVIASNDPDENPYNFNISGTAKGTNNIYVYGNGNDVNSGATTTALTNLTNFGSNAVTTGVKQNTFVVSNLSGASRYFSNITISGPDAAMFSVVAQTTNNALGSGNSTSFTINFTPTTIGTKNATITFSSYTDSARTLQDSNDPPTYTFAVSGIGIVYTVCNIGAVQTIAQQDFETAPATPTLGYAYTTDGTVTVAGGTYDNGSGPKNAFVGAKSFQFTGIGTGAVKTTVITLNAVDASQYTSVNLSLKTGAFRTGTTQGLDVNDFVQVESSTDGGTNWSTEAVLRAYSNSRWDFAATGVFNAYYTGTNNGATIDSRNGNAELPNGYATYYVRNLPAASNLLLRLTLTVDRNDEIWAIDNIKIEGQIPQITTWDGATWSAGFPTSNMKAIFDGNYTTSALPNQGSIQACECQINSGKIVAIAAGYNFEIQSNLTNEGVLNIANNASLIQINDGAINSGAGVTNATRTTSSYELYDYTYWSSPIFNPTFNSALSAWRMDYSFLFNTANFQDILTAATGAAPADSFDDNGDAWQHVAGTDLMIPAKGYAVMAPTSGTFPTTANVTFSGKPNNGIITIPMALSQNASNANDDFNLIGNPYPSAIYADSFINLNANISGTLYFWTHIGNISTSNPGPDLFNFITDDYAMYNLSGGTAASSTGSTVPTGYIASGQGFFVEATTATEVTFNNLMRNKNYNNTSFYRPAANNLTTNKLGDDPVKSRVWLNFQNPDGMFSQQLIAYDANATLGYDRGYDGFVNLARNYVSFYSFIDNDKYRIQSRSSFNMDDIVPLGFFCAVTGNFTISINSFDGVFANQNIYLQDNLLNTIHDLKQAPYSFTSNYGTYNNRFVLRYTDTALGSESFETIDNNLVLAASNNQISIRSTVQKMTSVVVYDLLGREIAKDTNTLENEIVFTNIKAKNQALIVKIKLENGQTVTRKIIL
ncbi:choice-of-anchor D domain-containing protein [Flavobacterium sp.]|uniref:choice-of-anchor D domain-containing protein n=1 Tax=Flavobacterium sp. TaxID=239 RepID=UPI0037523E37